MNMRLVVIAALVLAQCPLAPLAAADIDGATAEAHQRIGTFTGARVRIAFGGKQAGKPRLGLGLSGISQSRSPEGVAVTQYSEGLQIGFAADRRLGLSVGGRTLVSRGLAAQEEPEAEPETAEKEGGLSTLEIVGLVAGGVLVAGGIGLALLVDAMNDASE
jgi:hypothetical protein